MQLLVNELSQLNLLIHHAPRGEKEIIMRKNSDKPRANATAEVMTDRPATGMIKAPTVGTKGTTRQSTAKGEKPAVGGDKSPANAKLSTIAKGLQAKGEALATVLIADAIAEGEREEARKKTLFSKIMEIKALAREGHVAFRATIEAELSAQRAIMKGMDVTEQEMRVGGTSFASFKVMVSNWKTISTACELGYTPDAGKGWTLTLNECVAMKHSHASQGATQATTKTGTPTARVSQKAGRKAQDPVLKAIKALADLDDAQLKMVAGWIDSKLTGGAKRAAAFWDKLEGAKAPAALH